MKLRNFWLAVALASIPATAANAATLYGIATSGTISSIYTVSSTGAADAVQTLASMYSVSGDLDFLDGVVYVSNVRSSSSTYLYFGTVDLATGAFTSIYTQGKNVSWGGVAADEANDKFYYWDTGGQRLYTVDTSGNVSATTGTYQDGYGIYDLAYDSINGILYGVGYKNKGNSLYTIDTTTGTITSVGIFESTVANTSSTALGLAYDAATGTLYLTDGTNNKLYTLSTTTGAATLVGALSVSGISGLGALQSSDSSDTTEAPEASAWAMLAGGLLVVAAGRMRRRKA